MTPSAALSERLLFDVSIHSRLATGDKAVRDGWVGTGVSIHARLATGDTIDVLEGRQKLGFQFTPALRRATIAICENSTDRAFQFTPALRRATARAGAFGLFFRSFNSRPPCDGRPV